MFASDGEFMELWFFLHRVFTGQLETIGVGSMLVARVVRWAASPNFITIEYFRQ